MARAGRFSKGLELQYPIVVHESRQNDYELRLQYGAMAEEYGADAFVRHLLASSLRIDSREIAPEPTGHGLPLSMGGVITPHAPIRTLLAPPIAYKPPN
jgi:hypothetical protein